MSRLASLASISRSASGRTKAGGTLILRVRGEYFHEIKAGTKPHEFRRRNDYWRKRLEGRTYDRVVITWGYPPRGDRERTLEFPWRGYELRTITHPHFGKQPVDVFAIDVSGADKRSPATDGASSAVGNHANL